jgi:opacity protein-like surface antigen
VNNLSDALNLAGILLAQSLAFGAMMAAGTGWYKRFLSLTSGTNKKPAPRSSRGQSAQRRRPTTKR